MQKIEIEAHWDLVKTRRGTQSAQSYHVGGKRVGTRIQDVGLALPKDVPFKVVRIACLDAKNAWHTDSVFVMEVDGIWQSKLEHNK